MAQSRAPTRSIYGGTVAGTAKGRTLRGRWTEGAQSGDFLFVMADDGRSFSGRFGTGEWWTGGRIAAGSEASEIDRSSPRALLGSFVGAGNAARQGSQEALGEAASLLDFGDTVLVPGERLRRAAKLFDLIDLTTFRIWSIPTGAPAETLAVPLAQSGSSAQLVLTMRRGADGQWAIVAPTAAEMARDGVALLARDGGRPPRADDWRTLRSARDTMRAFITGIRQWDVGGRELAISALNLSQTDPATRDRAGELEAQYLIRLMDRIGLVPLQEIPDDPAGRSVFVVFEHPAGRIAIAPVNVGGQVRWQFTPDTVDRIDDLYAAVQSMPSAPHATIVPPRSPFFALRQSMYALSPSLVRRIGAMERWQIAGIVVLMALCLLAGAVLAWILRRLVVVFAHGDRGPAWPLRWPLLICVGLVIWRPAARVLGLPQAARANIQPVTFSLLAICGLIVAWHLVSVIGDRAMRGAERHHGTLDEIVLSLTIGVVRFGLIAVAAWHLAAAFALPASDVLAGLGISGLAIAIASKETLSNVFGAGILVADRPFRRGDWITMGEVQGTVEHVGVRSTRLRTIEDTTIMVPNGKLADSTINNWGSRRHRLIRAKLRVPFGPSPERVLGFVDGIRQLAADNPDVVPGRTQVGVSTLAEGGIDIDLSAYVVVGSAAEEAQARQELMLSILRLAGQSGINLGAASAAAEAHA